MAKTSKKVQTEYIDKLDKNFLKEQYMEATSGTPGAGQFYSEIENRAPMIDLSKDLGVRFGVNRITLSAGLKEINNEKASDGRRVFGVNNDKYNQIRFVGNVKPADTVGVDGARVGLLDDNDFVEITFYGTGLNILVYVTNFARDFRASVDGGAEGDNILPFGSSVLVSRNYNSNSIVNVVSGLDLGIHTVRIRHNGFGGGSGPIFGFEILNERADLLVPEGDYWVDGKLVRHLAEETIAYDSGFENEYGTAGTKGGHVSVYMDKNGQIKKDIQWTDATARYLGDTDHSNEEIVSRHNFREFGAARADDFSSLSGSTDTRAFTLDDGTTTLLGRFVERDGADEESVRLNNDNSSFITITFVGTGIDIYTWANAINFNANADAYTLQVDGGPIQNIPGSGSDFINKTQKIASGLPYGTHVVRIDRNTVNGYALAIKDFIIYQPKKPTLPEGAVELADYNLMADFTTSNGVALGSVATGVVRKDIASREGTYVGTWADNGLGPLFSDSGRSLRTVVAGSYVEYTFFGTGFEWRGLAQSGANDYTISVDGSSNFTVGNGSFWSGPLTDVFEQLNSGITWDNTTGNVGGSNAGGADNFKISLSGMNLGLHTIRFTQNVSNAVLGFYTDALDIITPIHSHKLNGPFVRQNTLRIGSQAVGDKRELKNKIEKVVSDSVGIVGNITYTAGSGLVMASDIIKTIDLKEDKKVLIEFYTDWSADAFGGQPEYNLFVNGDVIADFESSSNTSTANFGVNFYKSKVLSLSKGQHTFLITANTSAGGTCRLSANRRYLRITEID